jgi:hypothetical protein
MDLKVVDCRDLQVVDKVMEDNLVWVELQFQILAIQVSMHLVLLICL